MKTTIFAVCALSTVAGIAAAQQVSSSARASGSSNSSVSADKSGANVQSDNSANATGRTGVAVPDHRDSKEAAEAKPTGHAKDQKSSSAGAAGGLAGGTTVNAVLAKPIDSGKCKPGDPVSATAAQDVKSDGAVV